MGRRVLAYSSAAYSEACEGIGSLGGSSRGRYLTYVCPLPLPRACRAGAWQRTLKSLHGTVRVPVQWAVSEAP